MPWAEIRTWRGGKPRIWGVLRVKGSGHLKSVIQFEDLVNVEINLFFFFKGRVRPISTLVSSTRGEIKGYPPQLFSCQKICQEGSPETALTWGPASARAPAGTERRPGDTRQLKDCHRRLEALGGGRLLQGSLPCACGAQQDGRCPVAGKGVAG